MSDPTSARNGPRGLVRKITVTLVTGAVGYLAANSISEQIALQAAVSIFVAGVVFVTMFLIDVDGRLDSVETSQRQHAAATETLLRAGFLQMNEATELYGRVDASRIRTDLVTELVINSTKVNRSDLPPLITTFAEKQIKQLSNLFRDISNGSDSMYEGEDRDWMLDLTRSARESILAVSLTTVDAGVDGGLWKTDLGLRYLQLQKEATDRKVVIQRIFIAAQAQMLTDEEFLEICQLHKEMGVHVRLLVAANAPLLRATTMFDFIVFDGAISYESTPASLATERVRPIIINTRLVQDRERVADRLKRFHELWENAKDLSDDAATDHS